MKRQSFLKGSAVLLVMVLVTKIIGLCYKIPLTSMLGGTGMSCYSAAFAVFTPVFAIAAAGIPSALSRLVSEELILERYRTALKIRRTAAIIFFAVSVFLCALLILCSELLAKDVVGMSEAKWAIAAVALSLPPAAMMNIRRGWSEGTGNMNPTASSEIVETAAKLLFGLLGAYSVIEYGKESFEEYHGCFGHYCTDMREAVFTSVPYAAAAAALGVSAASFAACVFIFIRTSRSTRRLSAEYKDSPPCDLSFGQAAKKLLKFTLPAGATAAVATLSGMADLVTVAPCLNEAMSRDKSLFMSLSAYGAEYSDRAAFVYGAYTGLALTIFGLLPTFTAMFGKSILPPLTASYTSGNIESSRKNLSSVFLLSSAFSMAGGLGICFLAKPLLTLFFAGSQAEIAVCAKPLAILGIATVFMGISLPCMTALQACNKQGTAVGITLLGTAVKLILNILLISQPSINICGAAISTAVSQGVCCLLAVITLIRSTKSGAAAVKALFIPLLPSCACAFSAILSQRYLVMRLENAVGERFGVLISVAISAIICIISYTLLCISPKSQIRSIFSKKI